MRESVQPGKQEHFPAAQVPSRPQSNAELHEATAPAGSPHSSSTSMDAIGASG